jgi:hypothetical protein
MRRVQAQQRRGRLVWTGSVVVVIVAIFAVLIVWGLNRNKDSGAATTALPSKLDKSLSTIPAATYDSVGAGLTSDAPKSIDAPALTEGGKPRILYVGAEYCPFCAAERWAVVTALSRFGTFQGLGQTASSHIDAYPDTPTLSFHGSTYTSKYIAFKGYETQSNQIKGSSYAPLDQLSTADGKLFDKYDFPPYFDSKGAIPFIDFFGTWAQQGASYSPQLLAGMTHQQVADAINDPSSNVSKSVLGTANLFTAMICQKTDNKPADVCTSSGVTAAAAGIPQ